MSNQPVLPTRGAAEFWTRAARHVLGEPRQNVGRTFHPLSMDIAPYVTFRVKLVQSGGSNGSATTASTYTYHAYHPTDASNTTKLNTASAGAAVSPEKTSPVGLVTAATIGLGYYDSASEFKLYEAYEKPGTLLGCT